MRVKYLVLSLFLLAASVAFAAEEAPVAGEWNLHTSIAGNDGDQVCTFAQKANALTGTCKGDQGSVDITGQVDGKKVTWKYDMDWNGQPLTLVFNGTLDDPTRIAGGVEVQPMGIGGEFSAVKK